MTFNIARAMLGDPLPTERMSHERLGKVQALAVLASDALSSVAYATEAILIELVLAGSMALDRAVPIALGITALLLIVAFSYYQTIHAYPNGGGAYTVARENLGAFPGLVAGAALLIDYVLTVAVSASEGISAILSAFPELDFLRIELAIVTVIIITWVNLRGLRESGRVFAIPTYFFVVTIFMLILTALVRLGLGSITLSPAEIIQPVHGLTLFLILRAFAAGCTALTGVEAISNGVPIFQKPEADNAGKTLLMMVAMLVTMFMGITLLAYQLGIVPNESETVVSQIARYVFGSGTLYYLTQIATATILLLAANTSFSDFPRLSSLMAQDGYLPRQLSNVGDRLVYANGMLLLGGLAALIIIAFRANTHLILPLYALGVFISFSLSQSGMVVRWWKLRQKGWQRNIVINGIGAIATTVVFVIIAATKFTEGGWLVVVLLALLIVSFRAVQSHYRATVEQLSLDKHWPTEMRRHNIVVPVAGLNRGVVKAFKYAQNNFKGELHVVTVAIKPEETEKLREQWKATFPEVDLVVLPSPYRSVTKPLMDYIDSLIEEEGDYVTVVLPEFVPARWWHTLLHNQTALGLKWAFLFGRTNWKGRFRVLTDVPFYFKR